MLTGNVADEAAEWTVRSAFPHEIDAGCTALGECHHLPTELHGAAVTVFVRLMDDRQREIQRANRSRANVGNARHVVLEELHEIRCRREESACRVAHRQPAEE